MGVDSPPATGRIWPAPGGVGGPGRSAVEHIESQLKASGITFREQPFDAMTPAGIIKMTNVIGTIPGRRPERIVLATHYDTETVQGVHVPRCERRGVIDGRGARAGARAQDAAERIHDRAALPRRRGGGQHRVARSGQHLRQQHYVRAAQQAGRSAG